MMIEILQLNQESSQQFEFCNRSDSLVFILLDIYDIRRSGTLTNMSSLVFIYLVGVFF